MYVYCGLFSLIYCFSSCCRLIALVSSKVSADSGSCALLGVVKPVLLSSGMSC